MENNKIEYKWNKLFASMRFDTDEGIISLTPEEQQELIDDISSLRELKSDLLNRVICTTVVCEGLTWGTSYKVLATLDDMYVVEDDDDKPQLVGRSLFE